MTMDAGGPPERGVARAAIWADRISQLSVRADPRRRHAAGEGGRVRSHGFDPAVHPADAKLLERHRRWPSSTPRRSSGAPFGRGVHAGNASKEQRG
jgi:hypothetical protein